MERPVSPFSTICPRFPQYAPVFHNRPISPLSDLPGQNESEYKSSVALCDGATAMKNQATLENLEQRLTDLERKRNALVEIINDLRHEDGLPPRPPWGGGGGTAASAEAGAATPTNIRPDTFYGKKLQTAVREYLEMRRAAIGQSNPATPREIYNAIVQGGYQFETKDETIALISLRQLMRKRTAFFHKLPNGTYGLTGWYEHPKKSKGGTAEEASEGDLGDNTESEAATTEKMAAAS
jgi:hypothetical protein